MNPDNDYALCFDSDCPLCVWYTGVFVRTGLLKPGEAVPWPSITGPMQQHLDATRMANEIPLIDLKSGQAKYGIEAIVAILSMRYPWVQTVASWRVIKAGLIPLYKLVSYNRKVIVAKVPIQGIPECRPSFHQGYRIVFILLLCLLSGLLLGSQMHLVSIGTSFGFVVYALLLTLLFGWRSQPNALPGRTYTLECIGQLTMILFFALAGSTIASVLAANTGLHSLGWLSLLAWQWWVLQPQFARRGQYLVYLRSQQP